MDKLNYESCVIYCGNRSAEEAEDKKEIVDVNCKHIT